MSVMIIKPLNLQDKFKPPNTEGSIMYVELVLSAGLGLVIKCTGDSDLQMGLCERWPLDWTD